MRKFATFDGYVLAHIVHVDVSHEHKDSGSHYVYKPHVSIYANKHSWTHRCETDEEADQYYSDFVDAIERFYQTQVEAKTGKRLQLETKS